MDYKLLTQPAYYFNSAPNLGKGEAWFYLSFFALILVAIIMLKLYFSPKIKTNKPYIFFQEKYFSFFITCIIIAFVLIFFRWQGIPYLASRWLIICISLITLLKIIGMVIYILITLPKELINFLASEKYQKYIPKPKKLILRKTRR